MMCCAILRRSRMRSGAQSGRVPGNAFSRRTRRNSGHCSWRATTARLWAAARSKRRLMTVLLLIRHAETDAVGNRITGWLPGVSLTARGQQQAIRLGERLSGVPLRAVYASPLERAIHTAEAAARPHNLQVRISEAVGEVRMGEWSGLSYRELDERPEWRRFNQVRSMTRIPGGELMVETQARMVGELDRLRSAHPDEVFAVV